MHLKRLHTLITIGYRDLYVIGSFMSCHVIHCFLKQVYETKCIEPFIKIITVSERVLTFIIVKMLNINEYLYHMIVYPSVIIYYLQEVYQRVGRL